MPKYDVAIVGGGPAGSSCAWRLKEAGMEVVVLDKAPFPRDKVCAGWITPQVIESLELDVEDYRKGRVFQPFLGFQTGLMGEEPVAVDYPKPVSYGIRRFEFDHYLLERSGADLRLGEPLRTLEREKGMWMLNGDIRAQVLVGAGGHFCPVARHLGARVGSGERAVKAKEVEFPLPDPTSPEPPALFFCRDLKGYGWWVRKGDYVNIGLGREDNRGLSGHLEAFCRELRERGLISGDLPRFKGHAYLLYPHTERPWVADGVLLIGDAAGLAYPQSGEGIRPAVESGCLAADAILAGDLPSYRDRLIARLGSPRPGLMEHLPASLKRLAAERLMASSWFARHVLLDRWFLHRHQPAL
ncbi:MAG: NAD(P)/FAD-dependent oxidoreductase [Gammaproteobacteria bacterium]|nr:MAG: NAD(P)/FAD-dependent oxidoreductase [Gammaproteobacteria bacterium]